MAYSYTSTLVVFIHDFYVFFLQRVNESLSSKSEGVGLSEVRVCLLSEVILSSCLSPRELFSARSPKASR